MFSEVLVIFPRVGSNSKRVGIDQFNSISIMELERELELKDLEQNELNWN